MTSDNGTNASQPPAGGTAYLYVQDTLSDWEVGYLTAELNSGRFFATQGHRLPVRTVGRTREPVTTMGGLVVTPDACVDEVAVESTALFVVAGGDTWQELRHRPVLEKIAELLTTGVTVGAICGATTALAEAGLLDDRAHTSNTLPYLKMTAPHYRGEAHYQDQVAVADHNLITANSAGSLLFTRLILQRLGVMSSEALDAWYQYFATGDARHFFTLLAALPS